MKKNIICLIFKHDWEIMKLVRIIKNHVSSDFDRYEFDTFEKTCKRCGRIEVLEPKEQKSWIYVWKYREKSLINQK